ncbi:SAM-dependent methyltransferase UbiE/COQ5 family protein [Paracoccidioides lutzii Pb01]|uniref:Arsenite methyltransferase n=1 Tax=Paracoccidioides lutzii (strain ATCC MYA-826 / Pb01) TaxID=502779 RepID=C1GT59_PARBA|nr:SAM-dependent methyltransferase UbiE/COQ5 family protein [Paracoccidioides lutzii Pb01]EEH39242.2 SAM-dependent methyltransferase UbiE/COQ5 family protein [Paracoccidioides lutzii Pb01]
MSESQVYDQVQKHYSSAAKTNDENYGRDVAAAFGYSKEELASIPQDANLGLSCGNPLALAQLREGETVIDLGSGAGIDVFLASKNVSRNGKDMLARANLNKERTGATNVTFVESQITSIALPDGISDCIISNCVVNLVPEPDKQLVFNEMARLLKSGGRVAISDILAKKELTPELKQSIALYVGCIAGASKVGDYEKYLKEAGFSDILIVDAKNDLNVYTSALGNPESASGGCCGEVRKPEPSTSCCSGAPKEERRSAVCSETFKADFKNIDFNEWAGKNFLSSSFSRPLEPMSEIASLNN